MLSTQKCILCNVVTDLSLHYLSKVTILVVKNMERDDIKFITKTLNCLLIYNIEHFREEKLGHVDIMEEVLVGDDRILKVTGKNNMGQTTIVLIEGLNQLVLDEAK